MPKVINQAILTTTYTIPKSCSVLCIVCAKMDVLLGFFSSLFLVCASAHPMVAEERDASEMRDDLVETTTLAAAADVNVPTPSIPLNCTTGHDLPGACVMRAHCEYSTNAVDRTLYARKGYVKPCTMEEVCCPFEYIIPDGGDASQKLIADDAFDFDDDD